MNFSISLAAAALSLAGTVSFTDVEASGLGIETTPDFLQRAEVALERGNLDRVVGLIAPRVGGLRRANDRHLAYATLCNAQLRLKDYTSAGETCHRAAESEYANWSDYNNLGAWYYLTGDLEGAMTQFEKAAALNPETDAVTWNIEATVAAATR